MINIVSIIGSGQVGTSLALALVKNNVPVSIRMTDIDSAAPNLVRQKFAELGLSSVNITFCDDIKTITEGSDLITLATPVDSMGSIAKVVGEHINPGSIVIDTGSTKQLAITAIEEGLKGRAIYVPCHPGNGSQGSGPLTGDPGNILGANSWMFVVSDATHAEDAPAAKTVKDFFTAAGIQVATTDAHTHDGFFGRLSHLQHAIKFSELAEADNTPDLATAYASAGQAFKNSTRIALSKETVAPEDSSLVKMWVPIFDQNKEAIFDGANNFVHYVRQISIAIAYNEREELIEILHDAQKFRADIKDPRERENLQGELNRIVPDQTLLSSGFNHSSGTGVVNTLLRPYIIAVAQTLNARDIDPDLVRTKANPSFRDGTFAALFDPEKMADLLLGHSQAIVKSLDTFSDHLGSLLHAVDRGDKERVSKFIHTAQQQRATLGQPDWTVRPEYKLLSL